MSRLTIVEYNSVSALLTTVLGIIANLAFAVQLLAAWRFLHTETESEWESSVDGWRIDGVTVLWYLLSSYFASAAIVCTVGFVGIVRRNSRLVRFYRDYSIADFSFCTLVTAATTYALFSSSSRTAVCEELSHHPELMRDLAEMGLSLENCEQWFERSVLVFVTLMVVVIVVRLHFLFAVSNLYNLLIHQHSHYCSTYSYLHGDSDSDPPQKIYVIPPSHQPTQLSENLELVYTPVPMSSLPDSVRTNATEAWVPKTTRTSERGRKHARASSDLSHVYCPPCEQNRWSRRSHHRRYSYSCSSGQHRTSRSRSSTRAGAVCLPISPDEGLQYYDGMDSKV